MATYPKRSSYGIFVRFRRSRLALRRGVARLEDALAIAEQLRASRFHDRGDIFVVKEPEGTIVELAPAVGAPPAEAPGQVEPPAPAPVVASRPQAPAPEPRALEETSEALAEPRAPEEAPRSPGSPAEPSAPAGQDRVSAPVTRELATLLRLIAQADHVRGTVDRAHAARSRFERALEAAERAIQARGAPPAGIVRNQERLGAVRALAARSVASFERIAALMERRLEVAWAQATDHAP